VRMKTSMGGFVLPLALFLLCLALAAAAKTGNGKDKGTDKGKDASTAAVTMSHNAADDTMRLEGEKRFHSNCARCHAAPPKFAPRVMATIVRHMRVRATLTDEDARLILHYMTQ
jgi:mono/diheme cytochrome c family protein